MSYKGFVNIIKPKVIRGYLYNTDSSKNCKVALYINGNYIANVIAKEERKGLEKQLNSPSSKIGFSFKFDFPMILGCNIQVKNCENGEYLLKSKKAREDERKLQKKAVNIHGCVDFVSSKEIAGWAIDENNSFAPVLIDVLVDDKKEITIAANNMRRDIALKKLHPTGLCGFSYSFKNELALGNKVNIRSVYGGNLQKSPQTISAQSFNRLRTLIIGLPKSGTSILTYRIKDAYPSSPNVNFEIGAQDGLLNINVHENNLKNSYCLSKALFFQNKHSNYQAICELYDKVVWIIRDPRDQFISNFFYRWFSDHNPHPENFKKAYDRTKKKEAQPSKQPFYKLHEGFVDAKSYFEGTYGQMMGLVKDFEDKYFVLKYEDFVDGKFEKLNEYLGIEVSGDAEVPDFLNRVVRTKKYGNWRNWFNEKDVDFYKPLLDEYLDFFGYNSDDWDLNQNPILDPSKGSEYMLKLFTKTENKIK